MLETGGGRGGGFWQAARFCEICVQRFLFGERSDGNCVDADLVQSPSATSEFSG